VKTFAAEEEDRDHAAFPTLETALTQLDSHCGFNIEIKFSQHYKVGRVVEHTQCQWLKIRITFIQDITRRCWF
jgi:hypothetical protein